jgi:hypothetical protein
MPNHRTQGLPNDYREANEYSIEAAYRNGHREVDLEPTEPTIRMTSTEKRSTETLPKAELRDAEICKCNVQSSFLRAEAHLFMVSMTTSWNAYVLDMDRCHTAHAQCN